MNESMWVTGVFNDRESAESAYALLAERNYGHDDINVLMSDETRERYFPRDGAKTELGSKAAEGAEIGGAVGGTVGAIAAALAAVGTSFVVPGLGLVVAGPVAAALAGAGAGAAAGGLMGALVGWNIPEEHLRDYEEALKNGGILMGVKPRTEEDARHIQQAWKNRIFEDSSIQQVGLT